jgi:hypothetical protein
VSSPPARGLTARQKAYELNVEGTTHGTFAEIGAGQEVARWFFSAGHAAGTIAKTISAYDMAVSDALYGPTHHYVSRQRLEAMLRHEFTRTPARSSRTSSSSIRPRSPSAKRWASSASTSFTRPSSTTPTRGRSWAR